MYETETKAGVMLTSHFHCITTNLESFLRPTFVDRRDESEMFISPSDDFSIFSFLRLLLRSNGFHSYA